MLADKRVKFVKPQISPAEITVGKSEYYPRKRREPEYSRELIHAVPEIREANPTYSVKRYGLFWRVP
jgi:hypothetical protein